MALKHPSQIRDRSSAWLEFWQALRKSDLKPLVTPELIEEHKRNPTGGDRSHSAELLLVLDYIRSLSGSDKEFIYATKPYREFAIGKLMGRGNPVDQTNVRRFSTREAANHVIFLMRLFRFGLIDADHFNVLLEGEDS